MRRVSDWMVRISAGSHRRAVDNARSASTTLSQRRVERDEVELYLHRRYGPPSVRRPATGASRRAGVHSLA